MGALEFLIDSLPDSMDALETSGMPDMTSSGAVSRRAAHMQRVGRKALQQWAKEARRVRGLYDAGTRKGAVGMQEGFLKRGGERDGEGSKGDAAWGLFE